MDGGLYMSGGEKRRKAEIFFLNEHALSLAHTNAQAHTADTDPAAVKAITMIQTCPWEMV